MNYKKKKHLVCANFFGKVYQISHTTLLKYMKKIENSVIIPSSEKKQENIIEIKIGMKKLIW
jgi:hypothetical protein